MVVKRKEADYSLLVQARRRRTEKSAETSHFHKHFLHFLTA